MRQIACTMSTPSRLESRAFTDIPCDIHNRKLRICLFFCPRNYIGRQRSDRTSEGENLAYYQQLSVGFKRSDRHPKPRPPYQARQHELLSD